MYRHIFTGCVSRKNERNRVLSLRLPDILLYYSECCAVYGLMDIWMVQARNAFELLKIAVAGLRFHYGSAKVKKTPLQAENIIARKYLRRSLKKIESN